MNILDRFIKYVKVETTSKMEATCCPSTQTQFNLANILVEELKDLGVSDVYLSENCYVYGKVPSNCGSKITLGLLAHMDTSDQASGKNVTPIVHEYKGGDIVLPYLTITEKDNPQLKNYIGQHIITSSGDTLLGSDDKSGIAIIMTTIQNLLANKDAKYPNISICFTPDEEIGAGTVKFDMERFNADYGYTVDGGEIGEFEYENFNGATATVNITGKSYHPGDSFNRMKNATLILADFISSLPENKRPATTQGYDGFFHVYTSHADVETASCKVHIRHHYNDVYEAMKVELQGYADAINEKYGYKALEMTIVDSYRNMKEKIEPHMHLVDNALTAFKSCGVEPKVVAIRGGTDGARLSFQGLPCPNFSTGGHNFHGPYEYVPLESMEKMVDVITKVLELYAK